MTDNLRQLIRWNESELGPYSGSWRWRCRVDEAQCDDVLRRVLELSDPEQVNHLEAIRRRMHPLDRTTWANTLNVLIAGRATLIDLPPSRMIRHDGRMMRLVSRGIIQRDDHGQATEVEVAFFRQDEAPPDELSSPVTPVASIWKTARLRMLEMAVAAVDQPVLVTGMRLDIPEPAVLFANAAVVEVFGRSPLDMPGMNIEALLDSRHPVQADNEQLLSALIQGVETELLVRCGAAEGASRLCRWSMRPLGADSGGGVTMLSVITPLNDGAADDLKTALPTIGDWLPASFYMMDPITMNVVWPDREAESGSRRPNLAEALRNANTPERIAAIEVAMEQVLKLAPGQTHEFELPQVPEGPIDPVSGLAAKPTSMLIYRHMGLAAPAGQSTRILGMVQERPIAPAQPRPSSASRSLSADHLAALVRLASGTVHQINNKLGSIMAADSLAIELLREGGSKEETLELLGDVREEAKRCGRIVSELFAFLDPDSDHGARPRFDEMAMHARQLTRHDAERHGARVVVSEAPALPPMKIRPLHAKLLLAEVMRLLMTAGSQHIDLSARLVEDDRIRIEFFGEAGDTPIDLTRVDGDQSMIAICRSIAEEYGGNVLVESVDERQAIIAILVPVE